MKLIIFGPPGSGKGTQSKLLAKELKLKHISTGEIFRDELKRKTKLGIEVHEKYWGKGKLVPDNVTMKIIKNKIKNIKVGFIADGFPRTISQAKELDKFCKIDYVIVLDVPFHTLNS